MRGMSDLWSMESIKGNAGDSTTLSAFYFYSLRLPYPADGISWHGTGRHIDGDMPRLNKYHCWKSPVRRNYTDNYELRIMHYEFISHAPREQGTPCSGRRHPKQLPYRGSTICGRFLHSPHGVKTTNSIRFWQRR